MIQTRQTYIYVHKTCIKQCIVTKRIERTEKASGTLCKTCPYLRSKRWSGSKSAPRSASLVVNTDPICGRKRGSQKQNTTVRVSRHSMSIRSPKMLREETPPSREHAPSFLYKTSPQQPAFQKTCTAETRRAGMSGEADGSGLPHFWGGVGQVVFFDLLLRALVLLARVERPFHNPSLYLRNTTRRRLWV